MVINAISRQDLVLSMATVKEREDQLFWSLTKDGVYTVKSGYWLSLGGHHIDVTSEDDGLWRKIWCSQWPPKLKHFIWRACKESLPVNAIRHYRHMTNSPHCTRSCNEIETVCHVLLDCHKVRVLWQNHPLYSLIQDAPRTSFACAFKWMLSHASKEEIGILSSSFWTAWYCRNQEVIANKACDVTQVAASFSKLITDYNLYSQKLGVSRPPRVLTYQKWEPPLEGWVKINFDAHIGMSFRKGLGVVVRDHKGKVLLTGTRCMEANWSVQILEAVAAVYALEIARRFGYNNVQLEGDSLMVINAISRQDRGNAHINLRTDQIIESSFDFNAFACSFVSRNGNTVALMIARWDTGDANEKICMEPFPPNLVTLVDLDL